MLICPECNYVHQAMTSQAAIGARSRSFSDFITASDEGAQRWELLPGWHLIHVKKKPLVGRSYKFIQYICQNSLLQILSRGIDAVMLWKIKNTFMGHVWLTWLPGVATWVYIYIYIYLLYYIILYLYSYSYIYTWIIPTLFFGCNLSIGCGSKGRWHLVHV